MKKIAKLSMLVLVVLILATSMVSAATQSELKGDVLDLLKKLKNVKVDYTATVETVFNSLDLTEEQVRDITIELNYIEANLASMTMM